MGWWWLGGGAAPELLPAGCWWGSAWARGSGAAAVPAGGAAGGGAAALTGTGGPDAALAWAVENLTTAETAVGEEIFVFAGQKVILVLRHWKTIKILTFSYILLMFLKCKMKDNFSIWCLMS